MTDVYTGFWIDWEKGRSKGATLTLPQAQGFILVSFLTLFVQFSGACLWRVVCFILHQARSTTAPRDGLFQQQQIILRNAITAPNALWNLSRSTLAWRGHVESPFRQAMALILITVIHMSFFGVAGLFSSQIASTGAGSALVRSEVCGYPKEISHIRAVEAYNLEGDQLTTFNSEVLLGRLTLTKSATYARSCYTNPLDSGATDCNIYINTYLEGVDVSAVENATCPFGGNSCGTSKGVRYDSGHISSSKHLGINFPQSEDVSIRRVTSCAPIDSEQYATDWKPNRIEAFGGRTNTSVRFWEFGQGPQGCRATIPNNQTADTTFCVSQYQKDYWQEPYTVLAVTAYVDNTTASDFKPISDFQRDDADVTLISIFSKAKYTDVVDDPLFNAHNNSFTKGSNGKNFSTPTTDLSVLGCTEQYQFCNTVNTKCTKLTGLYAALKTVENGDLQLSPQQAAIFRVIWKAAWSMVLQWATTILDNSLLLAQDFVFTMKSTTSSPLPPNQWIQEAHNLHNLSLAVLQRRVNEFSSPENFDIRPGLNSLKQINVTTDPHELNICQLQKIRSTAHVSVSVLGMCVILGVGSILILLDWTLIQQIFWFRSVTHYRQAKKADWQATGMLQLHRQALEARAVGPWKVSDYLFPVLVEQGKKFLGLSVKHDYPEYSSVQREGSEYSLRAMDKGGQYSAISAEIPIEALGDQKGRAH
ncbi:hypothetical protein DPSP01_013940 [Paraphaeosphaeria sporulosa]|uniref:Uncharacterized protein n=1 Tax=Paraphaeosphaeria sporulosa TaxID=1460663 RepID=A0A177CEK7_9PLEO|nr:uncharacterized protein CC84DRAFT_744939 [Paraphaeosphaeria sporulosa]OAG06065.1 hypothetical protein CC84DRAFT_744939 [Paraphaeosphaeria sporulosa]